MNGALEPDIKSSALPLPGVSLSGQETTKNPQANPKVFVDSVRDHILLLVTVRFSRNNCLSLSIMQLIILLCCLAMVIRLAAANFHNFIFFSEPQQLDVFPIYYYRSSKVSGPRAKVLL